MSQWTWPRLKYETKIVGTPLTYSLPECEQAGLELGIKKVPPSYVAFMETFGAGEWVPDLTLFVPHHPQYPLATLVKRARSAHEALTEFLTPPNELSDDPLLQKISRNWRNDFDCKTLERLICIGGWGTGDELCWDPGKTNSDGEMALCIMTHEETKIIYCGEDLLEFLGEYLIEGKMDEVYPQREPWGHKAIFKAWE